MNDYKSRRELTPEEKFNKLMERFKRQSMERQKDLQKYLNKLNKPKRRKVKNDE